MLQTIVHRGPDGEGRLDRPGLALGMRRLAIIDLAGGDQPIFNEDGSVAVVFNGEIYNFRELRADLERRGHRFATRSDTEVLVHGYEQWGDEMLHRLVGMFAFALWDENRRRLLVARDRFGKKPLYYSHRGGEVVFGSEIKALLAQVSPRISTTPLSRTTWHCATCRPPRPCSGPCVSSPLATRWSSATTVRGPALVAAAL